VKPTTLTLQPGLYLVATPIGNARDISLRALDMLSSADVIAAEDTRTTRKLMDIHGIYVGGRQMLAYHDHSGASGRAGIIKLISEGKSVVYASEAGSPLIADPGFALARAVAAAGHYVTAIPGACAPVMALSLSGLPTDRFLFAGFPPAAKGARATWMNELLPLPTTLVIFESAKRIQKLLGELCSYGAENRQGALCRELTKKFEEVRRGTIQSLLEQVVEAPPKGEIVLVLEPPSDTVAEGSMEDMLSQAMKTMTLKDAAHAVAEAMNLPKRKVYQAALEIEKQR